MMRQITDKELRTLQTILTPTAEQTDDMIVNGKAITFDEPTPLFKSNGIQYYEKIDRNALQGIDLSNVFFYYNHEQGAIARTKNKTLELDVRTDGLYFKAKCANTTLGKDVYELVKRGDVDKCSFGFTILEDSFDEATNTFTVRKIGKLFEISCVDMPAYENTSISARAKIEEIQSQREESIVLANKRKAIILKTLY